MSFGKESPRRTNVGVGSPKSPPPNESAHLSSSESEDEGDDIKEDDEFEEAFRSHDLKVRLPKRQE